MDNSTNHSSITPESVLAAVREMIAESNAAAEKRRIEAEKAAEKAAEKRLAAFEQELEKSRAEADKRRTEADKELKALRELIDRTASTIEATAHNRVEAEKAADKRRAEADKELKALRELIGGISHNNGEFAEEYFFNSFENGQTNFFGEKFDEIEKNLKTRRQRLKDEFDIVMYNHTSIAIIEVKYKAHKKDVPGVLKKAETFRILYPEHKDFKIYLGLASMAFYPDLEQECIENGIAIIKQVGENVIINDKHLKTF